MATMTADEYREIVKTIINTATGGSVGGSYPWTALNNGTYSAKDFYNLMQTRAVKNAGYDAVLNADGSVRTYTYINKNGQIADLGSYDDIAGAFNSNYKTGTASGGTIQFTQATDTALKTATETAPSVVEAAGTMSKFTKGVKGVGHFVTGKVLPTIAVASAGIQLGKTIDSLLYNANPDFWNSHGMETLNPETWSSIASNDAGKTFLNALFGINPDTGNTQMYMDENALAYLAMYMNSSGVLSNTNEYVFDSSESSINLNKYWSNVHAQEIELNNPIMTFGPTSTAYHKFYSYVKLTNKTSPVYITNAKAINKTSPGYLWTIILISKSPFTYNRIDGDDGANEGDFTGAFDRGPITVDEITKFDSYEFYTAQVVYDHTSGYFVNPLIPTSDWLTSDDPHSYRPFDYLGAIILYGTMISKPSMDGISNQNDANVFDPTNITDIASALNALKEQYPDLWNNRVENSVVQPDGTTKTYTYVPVPMPTGGTADQPTTEGAKQSNPEVDPSTATDTLLNTLVQILTQTKPVGMTDTPTDPINPNPPDVGGGDTPVVVAPTGSANALYSIYNPSQAQLNSFGSWLWSSDFVDQLLKLFNDPMQAIIGLHKIFASPSISGTGNIKVGYLDSGVSSNIVGNQYTTVDCGSVSLAEYFGNVFDYEPYTKVNLYLPFIGIVPLSVGEVMRSTINVVYHVDVLTGACLAEVKIKRDAAGGTLFQYSGNAAVQYPISSGSYMGIISGIMSIAGGVAGTIATGGAAMPVLLGAGASVGRMHTDISHSGSFSGNAGAMGIKKPYLIIDRPQTALAKNFSNYIGYPSNTTVKLSSCSGFTKVQEIHLENVPATNNELSDIEMKLKGGVII